MKKLLLLLFLGAISFCSLSESLSKFRYKEKSCTAPRNGSCTATVTHGVQIATCTAVKGSTCTARIRIPTDS